MSKLLRPLLLTLAFLVSFAAIGSGLALFAQMRPQMFYYMPPPSFQFLVSAPFILLGLAINPLVWRLGRGFGVGKILVGGVAASLVAGLICINSGFGRYTAGDVLNTFFGDSTLSRGLIEASAKAGAINGLAEVGKVRLFHGRSDPETLGMLRRAADAGEQRAMHVLMLYNAGVTLGASQIPAPDLTAAHNYHCKLAAPRHNALAYMPGRDLDLRGEFGWTCPGDEQGEPAQ